MMTEAETTTTATNALTDLVGTARTRAIRARANGNDNHGESLLSIADTLDAARTRLVQDGTEYLDSAWAFVEAGRAALARLAKTNA